MQLEDAMQARQAALLHHAGSEERSVFGEAERLDEGRLRELGRQLANRLDAERTSRLRRSFRDLELNLLASVRPSPGG